MSDVYRQAPNEKWVEMLFCGKFLEAFQGSPNTPNLYAPSSRAEHFEGYDAMFTGAGVFRELRLQFKAAKANKDKTLSFRLNALQHQTLLRYPANTAFYICASFSDGKQIKDAQQNSQKNPAAFLSQYIAIDVHDLVRDPQYVRFVSKSDKSLWQPRYKQKNDPGHAKRDIAHFRSGQDLLCDFYSNLPACRTTAQPTRRVRPAGWTAVVEPIDVPWRNDRERVLPEFNNEHEKLKYFGRVWQKERVARKEQHDLIENVGDEIRERIRDRDEFPSDKIEMNSLERLVPEDMNPDEQNGGSRNWGAMLRVPLLMAGETEDIFRRHGLIG